MTKPLDLPKLPKAFKTRWVKALRSGEYKQGRLALRATVDGQQTYCCLGVACQIVGHTPTDRGFIEAEDAKANVPACLKGDGFLPSRLSKMNDGRTNGQKPMTFPQIAAYIERYL